MIDSEISVAKPRRCYFDIETDSRVVFRKAIDGDARVLCWAVVDADTGARFSGLLREFSDEAEIELLTALWERLANYDQVVGWNSKGFDVPIITMRSRILGASIGDLRRWNFADQMLIYKKYNIMSAGDGEEKSSFKLNHVAHVQLGEGKHDVDASKSFECWHDDPAKLVAYCVQDTDLLRRIEEKTGYLETFQTVCEVCGVFPDDYGLSPTNFVEQYLLREGQKIGQHFRNNWRKVDFETESYEGAFVLHPTCTGIQKNVHVADFSSMYPAIMITWNLSEDALANSDEFAITSPGNGVRTSAERTGAVVAVLEGLLSLRSEWNKRRASFPPGTPEAKSAERKTNAYKQVANSVYGVYGNKWSRFYNTDLAAAVTTNGRWLITHTMTEAKAQGLETIYGDTDSIFVVGCDVERFRDFVAWCNSDLYPRLTAECGCKTNRNAIAFEKSFERLVMTCAKRYVGTYLHYKGKPRSADSKPEVKGIEVKRGDQIRLARQLQQLMIDLFDSGCEDPKVYADEIAKFRERFFTTEHPIDDIVLSKALSDEVENYKSNGVHVKVAKVLADRGEEVREGARIRYVIVDGKSPQKAIPATDYTGQFDRRKYWEDMIFAPTLRLCLAMFPHYDFQKFMSPFKQLLLF
jgi:DNA polymerase I